LNYTFVIPFCFIAIIIQSCNYDVDKSANSILKTNSTVYINDTIESNIETSSLFKDSLFNLDSLSEKWLLGDLGFSKEDIVEKEKEVRKKFKRINSTKNWDKIEEVDIWKTLEGGIATFYFKNENINKIHIRNFGETFQSVQEFYLENDNLFFVFEIEYRYNRPMYYDTTMMLENNDNQIFDFDESTITETRHYFENKKLVRQISNQDCGAPNSQGLRNSEENRLLLWHSLLIEALSEKQDLSPD
jgi:hypothetical protein